jgi:hypothetical protein
MKLIGLAAGTFDAIFVSILELRKIEAVPGEACVVLRKVPKNCKKVFNFWKRKCGYLQNGRVATRDDEKQVDKRSQMNECRN